MEKFSIKSLLTIVVILLIGIVGLWQIQRRARPAAAGWFNDAWQYRKAITIGYTGASALTDFQVSVDVGTSALIAAGKMKSDCNDIRFTDQTGKLLDYWIEENNPGCNQTTDTKIWIKLPKVNNTSTGTNIYLYYGNTSASSVQAPDKVFDFFDNFSGGLEKWLAPDGGTWAIESGELSGSSPGTYKPANYTGTDYVVEAQGKRIGGSHMGLTVRSIAGERTYYEGEVHSGTLGSIFKMTTIDYTSLNPTSGGSGTILDNTNYFLKFIAVGTTLRFEITGPSVNLWQQTTDSSYASGRPGVWVWTDGHIHFDNFRVRKYASSDPTKTLLTEERSPAPIAYWSFDEGVGTSVFDSSSNKNHGYFRGTPVWKNESECISGKCLEFTNVANNIIVANNNTQLSNQYTFQGWYYRYGDGSHANYGIFLSKGGHYLNATENTVGVSLMLNNGQMTLYSNDGATSNNKWYFVSATYDGSIIKLYLDGKLIKQYSDNSGLQTITSNISIGNYQSYAYSLNGWVDELKVYPYVRSAAQIKQDYRAGLAGQKAAKGVNVAAGSKSAKSLSDGLVGYWKMDEGVGTTTADSSGNNNTGTLSGAGWGSGKFGIGTSYGGTNNVMTVPDTNNTLDLPNDFTIAFWVNPTSSGTKELIGKPNQGNYEFWQSNTNLSIRINGGTPIMDATSIFTYGQWTHVTVKYERSSGVVTVYQNGNYFTKGSNTNAASINDSPVQIGGFTNGTSYPFQGSLDEVRIYNRALNPAEVTALYEYAPGPVAYYNFEEGIGTSIFDRSGNGNNGSWQGTLNNQWMIGKYGKGGNFNGSNNYILGTNNLGISGNAEFSMCAWIKWTGSSWSGNWPSFMGNSTTGSANNGLSFTISSGRPAIDFWNNRYRATNALNVNTWYYICGVKTAGTISTTSKIYVNGQIVSGAYEASNTIPNITDSPPIIGRLDATRWFQGIIDEVKFYNYARTQKQILQDMNANVPVGAATKVSKPIAWYKFDEGQGTVVNNSGSIGSTLNGTFGAGTSAPTWTTGKSNKGLNFDGNDDYTEIANNSMISGTGQKSISMWIKPGTKQNRQDLFSTGGCSQGTMFNLVYDLTTDEGIYFGGFSRDLAGNNNTIIRQAWNHVSIVYDGNVNIKMYINGNLNKSGNLNGTLNVSSSALRFGRGLACDGGNAFQGLIDEVKIYNYALSADEIKQDYNQGSSAVIGKSNQNIGGTITSLNYCIPGDTSPCSPPIAEYNFEENIGTTAYDTSGNSNHIPFSSGTAIPSWTTGKIGAALNFDGSNDLAQKTNFNASQLNTAGTIECWFKAGTTQNGNARIVETGTAADRIGFFVNESSNNKLVLYWVKSGVGAAEVVSTNTINDNQWHYASGYWNSSGLFLYVDGIYNNTNPGDRTLNLGNSVNLTLGNYVGGGGGYTFNGKIDDIKIYNYARTPAQIAYDYNKGAPIGWWKMDECEGNIVHDASGLGNTGTITIGAGGSQVSLGTCSIGDTSAWSNGATGKINSAMSFDGTDDFIEIPHSDILVNDGTDQMSWSFWVNRKQENWQSLGGFISKYNTTNNQRSWAIREADTAFGNESGISGNISENGINNQFWESGNGVLTDGGWTHVVVTYNTGVIKVYSNGTFHSQHSTRPGLYNNNQTTVRIGQYHLNEKYTKSKLDDVRIYNYALTAEQVKQVYNGGAVSFN